MNHLLMRAKPAILTPPSPSGRGRDKQLVFIDVTKP